MIARPGQWRKAHRLHLAGAATAVLAAGQGCVTPATSTQRESAQPAAPPLATEVGRLIASAPLGTTIGIAYVNLGRPGDTLFANADTVFHAASTMKVPVMLRLYRMAGAGTLDLARRLPLRNRFASIVDRSQYALDPRDDSDSSMYRKVGDSVTTRELIEHMITRSSNLATNALIALANPDSVNAMMRSLGATRMRVLRGVEDQKAFERGLNNTATARDLATLLVALETGRAASPAATRAMRTTLLAQAFNEKIPAGLPPGTPVAHKTGEITGISHDAAIVYPRGAPPYVLVVLTRGFATQAAADTAIAGISRAVYRHATRAAP